MKLAMGLEGVDILEFQTEAAIEELGANLVPVVNNAALAAIKEMQTNHPYTDRTGRLTRGMRARKFGRTSRRQAMAIVTFEAPYANIVNNGSKKMSQRYPFLPQGEGVAERSMLVDGFEAISIFIHSIGMGR